MEVYLVRYLYFDVRDKCIDRRPLDLLWWSYSDPEYRIYSTMDAAKRAVLSIWVGEPSDWVFLGDNLDDIPQDRVYCFLKQGGYTLTIRIDTIEVEKLELYLLNKCI